MYLNFKIGCGRFYKVFIGLSAFAQIFPRSQAMKESNISASFFVQDRDFTTQLLSCWDITFKYLEVEILNAAEKGPCLD
jgi:hypothetical protein